MPLQLKASQHPNVLYLISRRILEGKKRDKEQLQRAAAFLVNSFQVQLSGFNPGQCLFPQRFNGNLRHRWQESLSRVEVRKLYLEQLQIFREDQ